jgi:hypothetical protein
MKNVESPGNSIRLWSLGLLVGLAVLVLLAPESVGADTASAGKQQVWVSQIAKLVKEPPGWTAVERHETGGVAFSPDDKLLAVTLGHVERDSGRDFRFDTHLLIVDAASPEAYVRQFDFKQACGFDPAWNDRGDMILVCDVVLRPADGASCAVNSPALGYSKRAYWLDSDHVVRSDGGIFDLGCKRVDTWQLEQSWEINAVAASKGWILQWNTEGPLASVVCLYSIVDRTSHQVLIWPTQKSPCGANLKLAVGAGAFCLNFYNENTNGSLHCRPVEGGKEIPVPSQVRGYQLEQAATSSARVVAEKWEEDRGPGWALLLTWWVPVPGYPVLPIKGAVFDLRSKRLIASWKPRTQSPTNSYFVRPYHYALSTAGHLLAESGDGVLELYSFPR